MYVATDHKPLMGTFGDRNREHVENLRLRRLKEQKRNVNRKVMLTEKVCQPKRYVNRKGMSTEKVCQQKSNVNQQVMSTKK